MWEKNEVSLETSLLKHGTVTQRWWKRTSPQHLLTSQLHVVDMDFVLLHERMHEEKRGTRDKMMTHISSCHLVRESRKTKFRFRLCSILLSCSFLSPQFASVIGSDVRISSETQVIEECRKMKERYIPFAPAVAVASSFCIIEQPGFSWGRGETGSGSWDRINGSQAVTGIQAEDSVLTFISRHQDMRRSPFSLLFYPSSRDRHIRVSGEWKRDPVPRVIPPHILLVTKTWTEMPQSETRLCYSIFLFLQHLLFSFFPRLLKLTLCGKSVSVDIQST